MRSSIDTDRYYDGCNQRETRVEQDDAPEQEQCEGCGKWTFRLCGECKCPCCIDCIVASEFSACPACRARLAALEVFVGADL